MSDFRDLLQGLTLALLLFSARVMVTLLAKRGAPLWMASS